MKYPKLYLVLDNCFAVKRWVRPAEWMEVVKELGFNYVQASTDNEIDPIFSPPEYMDDWFREVKHCEKTIGVKVANFYTGYQTYRTVGLAHHDKRVRRKVVEEWFKPLIRRIADLKSTGIGIYYHAIPDEALQDPDKYEERTRIVKELLGEIAVYAYENGIQISLEQMYDPHQPPWTIDGARQYLKDVLSNCKKPLYITLDVGHMIGQRGFLKASGEEIKNVLINKDSIGDHSSLWLGSDSAYEKLYWAIDNCKGREEIEKAVTDINNEMDKFSYFFAEYRDGDTFEWLAELACYSPIIHMQQTNGFSSNHLAFTPEINKDGIITGDKLLNAIAKSYQNQAEPDMPPVVENIYLSFEIFAANVEKKKDILTKLKQTLDYWRNFIPEDGMPLNELLK